MRRLAFACIALLVACNPRTPLSAPAPSKSPSPSPSALSLIVSGKGTAERPLRFVQQTKNNRKQYELVAHSFRSQGKPGAVVGRVADPDMHFWGVDGSRLEATAPTATIDQQTGIVGLEGGVRAKNSAGVVLTCDRLTYDHTTEMLHGEGHVVITNPNGFRATGTRIDSNVALTNTRMQ
jgi:lipopolysaccharide assembly outer membrane protein LptD (OstA)